MSLTLVTPSPTFVPEKGVVVPRPGEVEGGVRCRRRRPGGKRGDKGARDSAASKTAAAGLKSKEKKVILIS